MREFSGLHWWSSALQFHHRPDDPHQDDGGSVVGDVVVTVDTAWRGPTPADLGQRDRHRSRQQAGNRVGVFTGALATMIHQPDLLTVEVRQPGRQSGS